jgi:hypothetical protein
MDRSQDILTTPQRQQQHVRHALCELAHNVEESPRRRFVAPRPETPTPLPGYVERTRASSRALSREACNADLLGSPRRRRVQNPQDQNVAPNASTVNNVRVVVDRQLVRCYTKIFFFYQFSFDVKALLTYTLQF